MCTGTSLPRDASQLSTDSAVSGGSWLSSLCVSPAAAMAAAASGGGGGCRRLMPAGRLPPAAARNSYRSQGAAGGEPQSRRQAAGSPWTRCRQADAAQTAPADPTSAPNRSKQYRPRARAVCAPHANASSCFSGLATTQTVSDFRFGVDALAAALLPLQAAPPLEREPSTPEPLPGAPHHACSNALDVGSRGSRRASAMRAAPSAAASDSCCRHHLSRAALGATVPAHRLALWMHPKAQR